MFFCGRLKKVHIFGIILQRKWSWYTLP